MIIYNKSFSGLDEKRAFVRECEDGFEAALEHVSCEIASVDNLKIITLTGPTCSGKTTTSKKLTQDLRADGKRVFAVSIDDFYRPRAELEREAEQENRPLDLDSVSSIDLHSLGEFVSAIRAGGQIDYPRYDFTVGQRTAISSFPSKKYDVYLFEGIQAMYPEVTAMLGGLEHRSVFISVGDDITVNGSVFDRRELRFLRRMVRDYRFRNTAPDITFDHWGAVAANEDKCILPYADKADLTVSSLMLYEPFLMKVPVCELLQTLRLDSDYTARAEDLLNRFRGLPQISPLFLPEESVYREFLG